MSAIRARGLVKRFGPVTALAGVDLDVRAGELVALLGPNGAGKSTLLRILGTTVMPDAGQATAAGHDVEAEPAAVRGATGLMLGDERSWYWRLSGRRNLEFFARLHGLEGREARLRAGRQLEQVGLTDSADRMFAGYSSGMRARLSLARALIADPQVLLLDEPTQNLDPVSAVAFRERIAQLAAERQVATLFVTHDLHEAAAIGDRIVALVDGRIEFERERGVSAEELESALLEASVP